MTEMAQNNYLTQDIFKKHKSTKWIPLISTQDFLYLQPKLLTTKSRPSNNTHPVKR